MRTTSRPRGTAASAGRADGIAALRARAAKARARNAGRVADDRAHRLLDAYLAAAERHGRPAREVIADLARGEAAWQIGMALHDQTMAAPPDILRNAACGEGCAFCCILSGGDGGTTTEAEATRLHAALAGRAGEPDGRNWHPEACPALDPDTRACRAYDARPIICRSFLSTDASACEANAQGGTEPGSGLLGSHLDYLAVLALIRETLKGMTRVPTYSLAQIAASAVGGADLATSLDTARHPSRVLDAACRDMARAGAAGRGRRL
ncbi:YkgJ family cysteine cluster protein [Sinisalibacter aestuarii]|uniref:YkgJ family cysteine cluster protein n=1 Tax=Sinisalibacter aestuarii TaxID=2949426 RepID=A0ABQ5LU51_9RHOB|nr:YkgJ family cysteine cluster protein [Sinisalibacter aestuarii]GKY88514.1 hypothetical protein STA1M1_23830 [Sinisalibacter aestuarii]